MDAPAGRAWTRLRTRPWTRLQDVPVKCACKARRRIRELRVPTAGAAGKSPCAWSAHRMHPGNCGFPGLSSRVQPRVHRARSARKRQGTARSQGGARCRELRVPRTGLCRTTCTPGTVSAPTTGKCAAVYAARVANTRRKREGKQPQGKYIATKVTLTRAEQETIALSSRSDGHRTHTVAVKKKEVPAAPYRVQGMYVLWFLAMSAERPRMSAGLGLLIKVDRGQRPRNVRGL